MSAYSAKHITSYVEFPALVHPKLKGGSIHKILINESEIDISTYPGIYGNQESRTLLTIWHSNVIAATYAPPVLMALTGYCQISYRNQQGHVQSLKFCAVDSQLHPQNHSTEVTAITVEALRLGGTTALPPHPIVVKFSPPNLKQKSLYAIYLLVSMVVGIVLKAGIPQLSVVVFLGPLMLSAGLVALGIDYMRFYTAWHPVIKVGMSILLVCVAFLLFVTTMALFEAFGII